MICCTKDYRRAIDGRKKEILKIIRKTESKGLIAVVGNVLGNTGTDSLAFDELVNEGKIILPSVKMGAIPVKLAK